jgi:predicted nucleotidyltransferase
MRAYSVAYLFGSHAKKLNTPISDVDIAILLSETPKNLFEYPQTVFYNI